MATPEDVWIKFFTDAGLPSDISATYALTFTENRIRMNMLLDLNKEYLKDMGIVCMGDTIAILRHAKEVHAETARNRVLASSTTKIPIATVPARLGQKLTPSHSEAIVGNHINTLATKRSVDSNSMISERLGKIRVIATKRKITPPDNSNADAIRSIPIKLIKTNISHQNDHYRDSSSLNERVSGTNVFSRLGSDDVQKKNLEIDTDKKIILRKPQQNSSNNTVFSRLGEKESNFSAKETSDLDKSSKLRNSSTQPNKIIIKTNGSTRTLSKVPSAGTMRADKIHVGVRQKPLVIIPQRKTVKFSPHVDFKLIEKSNASALHTFGSSIPVNNLHSEQSKKIVKLVSAPNDKNSLKLRLGNSSTNKVNVFNRLGIQNRFKTFS